MGDGFLEVFKARDISISGLSVFVPHDFDGYRIDGPVDLVLKIGAGRSFTARGVIRHRSTQANDHFFGVQFTSISDENLKRIRQYVEQRLVEGGEV
jgi:hypothetical protein